MANIVVVVGGHDETTTTFADETLRVTATATAVVSASHGVSSCSHDSAATLNSKPGQQLITGDERQLTTTNSKKCVIAEEALAGVVVIVGGDAEEEEREETLATINTVTPGAPSKSYLRRLGDYLNRRRIRTASGSADADGVEPGADEEQHQQLPGEDLSNVIYRDSVVVEDKVVKMMHKQQQGNYVISDEQKVVNKKQLMQDSSDISDVDDQEASKGGLKAPKAHNGYLLPRVFLNKEG